MSSPITQSHPVNQVNSDYYHYEKQKKLFIFIYENFEFKHIRSDLLVDQNDIDTWNIAF